MKKIILVFLYVVFCVACEQPKIQNTKSVNSKTREDTVKKEIKEINIPEFKKERVLIYPIDYEGLDAYGYKIKSYFPQWYVVSTKVKALVPVDIRIWISETISNGPVYTDYPTPKQLVNHWSYAKLKYDTFDLSFFIPGLGRAIVLNTGEYEIAVSKNRQIDIKKSH